MPSKKKQQEVAIEEMPEEPIKTVQNEKPKKTRTMTPEMLEKLKHARELALKARREKPKIEEEHKQIKETFGQKLNEVETFKTLKQKAKQEADEEVKKNEIVSINKRLEDLYGKFDGYLQEKAVRRQLKEQTRQEKKTSEIVRELPAAVSKNMLEQQLKDLEIQRWRQRYFGL